LWGWPHSNYIYKKNLIKIKIKYIIIICNVPNLPWQIPITKTNNIRNDRCIINNMIAAYGYRGSAIISAKMGSRDNGGGRDNSSSLV